MTTTQQPDVDLEALQRQARTAATTSRAVGQQHGLEILHDYLVHGDGSPCADGCDRPADRVRMGCLQLAFDEIDRTAATAAAKRRPNRRPHSDTAGYVTERESQHPRLPGHFVLIDRERGGDWIDADHRWLVVHMNGDACGCLVSVPSRVDAHGLMVAMAAGSDVADFGQHDGPA